MSRRAVRAPIDGLRSGEVELPAATARYLRRVHRLGPGDHFVAFDPDAVLEADAELLPSDVRRARARLGEPRPGSLRPERLVTLLQAMGKGDKLDAVVRDATELGVSRLQPVVAQRSVRRPGRAETQVGRWQRIAVQAARQCGRGDAPAILPPADLAAALHGLGTLGPTVLGLCLHPEADEPIGTVLRERGACGPVIVLCGPEGGLTADEIALARSLGFRIVTLGPLVLRTETACAAVMGALLAFSSLAVASRDA